jgi:arsenate reductase
VGPLDDYYVVVTLSREAEDHCPPLPYRTIQLFWDLPDPSRAEGSAEEVEAAYDEVYAELDAKIADLIGAMQGARTPEEAR